ncbi:acyl dehydratase [Streptomyces sp. 9-7]|uniref:Acyl dehydratase n=1 Tax=Streptomyces siderophoricus TaxID=2802281 RepID=A0ABS1MUJ8_9ACTN|nr:MaoC/PaaZ C-terminal domain-containing protein [Streptomyces sp. 9-7]MBL1091405.1 acyl dehydratase [Streptomyces sp. 9-7]
MSDQRTPDIRAGDVLPALEIPITRTLIVAGALASRDYQDVHHDVELAQAKGSPDIFMNILTTNGLVGRYLTDHFGPTAVLQKLAIRLGAPNYPGDTMMLTGTITEVDAALAPPPSPPPASASASASATAPPSASTPASASVKTTVQVHIVGTNALGHHVTGTATLHLPPGGATASCTSSPRRSPEGTV